MTKNWRARARCHTENGDDLFVSGARQREARTFCRSCPVRTECLAHALDQRIEFGVWGGLTERELDALVERVREALGAHRAAAAEGPCRLRH